MILHAVVTTPLTSHPYNTGAEHAGFSPDKPRDQSPFATLLHVFESHEEWPTSCYGCGKGTEGPMKRFAMRKYGAGTDLFFRLPLAVALSPELLAVGLLLARKAIHIVVTFVLLLKLKLVKETPDSTTVTSHPHTANHR